MLSSELSQADTRHSMVSRMSKRIKGMTFTLGNHLMPDLRLPRYCPRHDVKLKLIESRTIKSQIGYNDGGEYTWECPQCGYRTQQRFSYTKFPDIMW
jgi:hypothetical protein